MALLTLGLATPAGASNLPQIWVQRPSLPTGFVARWDAPTALFPPGADVVLFGGAPAVLGDPWRNDTWLYDTATSIWRKGPAAPTGLTPRGGGAMAYLPSTGKLVMFGGGGASTWSPSRETWLFDGSTWTQGPKAPAGMAGRVGAGMAYMPSINKLVLFGGTGAVPLADTWLFDGSRWTKGPASPAGLLPRAFFGMTYDAGIGKIVVAGGSGQRDVWYFNGSSWTQGPSLPEGAGYRDRTALAYDPDLGGDVLFGGLGPTPANRSVYLLKGDSWTYLPMHPQPAPTGRLDPGLLWDPGTHALLTIGGVKNADNGQDALSEAWALVAPPVSVKPGSGPVGTSITVSSGPGWVPGTSVTLKQGSTLLGTFTAGSKGLVKAGAKVAKGNGTVKLTLTSSDLQLSVGTTFSITSSHGQSGSGSTDASTSAASSATGTAGASAGTPAATAAGSPTVRATADTPKTATGQVTARAGQFWLGSSPILLHGIDAAPIQNEDLTDDDYTTIASWHMNVIRMRIYWSQLEPTPPVKQPNGTWQHTYNQKIMDDLKDQVGLAAAHGEYVVIENYCGPPCITRGWPDWLYEPSYNSHGKTYTDPVQANTDYWSDPLQQAFTKSFLIYLAQQLEGVPGVIGYEPLNEPNKGSLPEGADITRTSLATQLTLAKAVRANDPPRVIFFTTRGSSGEGLPNADLSGFTSLGNVAFDLHDYFGGRWGEGLNLDPASATYGESMQSLYNFTLTPDGPPYLGTTLGQIRFLKTYTSRLQPKGIPLFIGEFGGRGELEPNINTLYWTMTQALNLSGVSWAAQSYNGDCAIVKDDGSFEPWVKILSQAARYPN